MTPLTKATEETESLPARSSTPTAWATLGLLGIAIAGWVFFEPLLGSLLRATLMAASLWQGDRLVIEQLSYTGSGIIQARGVEWFFGPADHRSSWKSEWIEIHTASLAELCFPGKKHHRRVIRDLQIGNSRLLLDRRGTEQGTNGPAKGAIATIRLPLANFLPRSFSGGPAEVVVIGEKYRLAARGLIISLPDQWSGKVFYSEAELDVGSWHRPFPKAAAVASWDGTILRIGGLSLGKDMTVEELSLAPREGRLDFGIHGSFGKGLLRGDGAVGSPSSSNHLEVTLVGEQLSLEALAEMMGKEKRASGTIDQARVTFRGDTANPMEADSSVRLLARDFRWEGRGWDSLRLAATMTGRNISISELSLQQKENELVAEGQSRLPEDWHAALKAPFTASFHATLQDAGALATLVGPEFAQLAGGLMLEGEIRGADNKAEGYCNLLGTAMKIRNLPVDWLKGCLIFDGGRTHLSYLQAWSGKDTVSLEGQVENSRPHSYKASAQVAVNNLTKRLAQLGFTTADVIGGGAVKGTWRGEGNALQHFGSFQATVSEWVSRWTKEGMTGSFEGTYAPSRLTFSKAEFRQGDLRLSLQLDSSPAKLEIHSITASRGEKEKPLVEGGLSLPVDVQKLWQTGDLIQTLVLGRPLSVQLSLHGIKAEELADLLGQRVPFNGTLDGSIVAAGKPEDPQLHSALHITRFAFRGSANTNDLSLKFDSERGRATGCLIEEPDDRTRLTIVAEVPFLSVGDNGTLRVTKGDAVIHGSATFRQASLDGWASFLGATTWPLHDTTLNGSIAIGGTVMKPSLEGSLTLGAREVILPKGDTLHNLSIPIICSNNAAIITVGTAIYQGCPLSIRGEIAWKALPIESTFMLTGKQLPLPVIEGLESWGDVNLRFGLKEGAAPTLGGTIDVQSIYGGLKNKLTMSFSPPGVFIPQKKGIETASQQATFQTTTMDLVVKTVGEIPLLSGSLAENVQDADQSGVKLQANLRLQGALNEPRLSGEIIAKNTFLELPAGPFFVPTATIRFDQGNNGSLSAKAYGITRLGTCILDINGSQGEINPRLEAPPGVLLADLMLSLMEPLSPGYSATTLMQSYSWVRQNQLFHQDVTGWSSNRLEKNEPAALGFYGTPWCWMIGPREASLQNP